MTTVLSNRTVATRVAAIAVLLLGLAAPAGAAGGPKKKQGHDATVHHGFEEIDRWVERFEDPGRDAWQKPGDLLLFLSIYEGQTIVDLGAGTGYMEPGFSAAVGETGVVYAVDIEQKMVEHLRAREDYPYDNVRPVLADPDDPKLPAGEVDLIFVLNTWHHIDDRLTYLGKLRRALNEGGRIAVVDWQEGDLPEGPPAGHKLSRDAVVREFAEAGWIPTAETVMLPYQYALIFMPREQAEPEPLTP